MLRFVLCAVAFAGLPAHAQAGSTFKIDFPAGWSAPVLDGETTEVRAPANVGDAWCRANSHDMPSLASTTQAQINAAYPDPWSAQTWADVLTVEVSKIQVFEGVSTVVDGRLVQEATIVFDEAVLGKKVTARLASHVLVGRMLNALCFARSESFDGMKSLFQTTIASLKPG